MRTTVFSHRILAGHGDIALLQEFENRRKTFFMFAPLPSPKTVALLATALL
jgi:hypothetical protein